MKKHPVTIRFVIALLVCAAFLLLIPAAAAESGFEPFFRLDAGLDAWQKPLKNARFLTRGAYTLKPMEAERAERCGLDPDYMPDTKGMDTLDISGSAEFCENHFRDLAKRLRELADGKEIYVVDCRIEGHALLNGISVSWYGDRNWAYKGMTPAEAEADELKRAKRIRQVYDYLQEMDGNYTVPWSEWITNRETEHYDKKSAEKGIYHNLILYKRAM